MRRMGYYKFQELDLGYIADVLRTHKGAYIGWERGLGKTLGAISLIDELECRRVLVVCPNTAKESVWAAELQRFLPEAIVTVLPNQKLRRERRMLMVRSWFLNDPEFSDDTPHVLIVHYEALAIIAGKTSKGGLADGWRKYGEWDLVIADEAHRLKNTKAQMTRAIKKVPAKYKLALSGSIIQNHAEEIFSPLQWLFPDHYRSQWRDWNDRWLEYIDGGYSRICIGPRPERIEDLRKELGVFMVYRRKEDELDLPLRTDEELRVEISPKQRKAYDELQRTCLASLDSGEVVSATTGLVLLTRLRQVASGLDLVSDKVLDSSKLDLAQELILDDEDAAYVVFSWFKASTKALAERLERKGVGTFVVTGDTPQADRSAAIRAFQAGQRRVFIGTISTLGESVNLHRASRAIFLDRSWNPSQNRQAEDRIYRIGQKNPVTITHIVAKDTVDETRVQPVLTSKEQLRKAILGG